MASLTTLASRLRALSESSHRKSDKSAFGVVENIGRRERNVEYGFVSGKWLEDVMSEVENDERVSSHPQQVIVETNLILATLAKPVITSIVSAQIMSTLLEDSKEGTKEDDDEEDEEDSPHEPDEISRDIMSLAQSDTAINASTLLGWQRIYNRQVCRAVSVALKRQLRKMVDSAPYDRPCFNTFRKWTETTLWPCLREDPSQLTPSAEFGVAVARSFVRRRSERLFDIIADFPDSLPALRELSRVLAIEGHVSIGAIGRSLRASLDRRLLHAGVSTSQILEFYIATIRGLRVVDTSDALLTFVTPALRAVLRHRTDAVRCILQSLVTHGGDSASGNAGSGTTGDLRNELRSGGSLAFGHDEEDEESGPGKSWVPRKRHADLDPSLYPTEGSTKATGDAENSRWSSTRGLDILAMLVSIYGSSELFIQEYHGLLAQRLLSAPGFAIEDELANVELLKIRFGEDSLHSCEVMLRDMEDSKRVTTTIHAAAKQLASVSQDSMTSPTRQYASSTADKVATVEMVMISENYWPPLGGETMAMHSILKDYVNDYLEGYHAQRKPRRLYPIANLGHVKLDIEFDDGTIRSYSCNPVQANVIAHMGEVAEMAKNASKEVKPFMSLNRLSLALEMDSESVLSAARFWVSLGVIREERQDDEEIFTVNKYPFECGTSTAYHDKMELDTDSTANSLEPGARSEIEGFITELLRRNGSMEFENLQTMLELMVELRIGQHGTSLTSKELAFVRRGPSLRQLLVMLVDSHVVLTDGVLFALNR